MENSHNKLRPSLPRSKDLRQVDPGTVREPTDGRGSEGRFAPGNSIAVGRGWKHAIAKPLGREATEGDVGKLAADAWKIYLAVLRELPHDGASVRTNVARHARESAVAAYFDAKADEAGLDTDRGILLSDKASAHGARAERHIVTALDVATRLAGKKKNTNAIDRLRTTIKAPR